MKTLYIKEFSKFPGPRYVRLGAYSGELFRDTVLIPAINEYDEIAVDFDEVFGYGSSFLEESFGGLVRKGVDRAKIVKLKNNLISKDQSLIFEVQGYISDALNEAI